MLHSRTRPAATHARLAVGIALIAALLTASVLAEFATRSSLVNATPEARVGALALSGSPGCKQARSTVRSSSLIIVPN